MSKVRSARFQTQYDGIVFKGEVNSGELMTRPSKTLSLREIIKRDLSGMLVPSKDVVPVYDEDNFVPDFKRMDLVDLDNYRTMLHGQKREIEDKIREEAKERKRIETERRKEADKAAANDGSGESDKPAE